MAKKGVSRSKKAATTKKPASRSKPAARAATKKTASKKKTKKVTKKPAGKKAASKKTPSKTTAKKTPAKKTAKAATPSKTAAKAPAKKAAKTTKKTTTRKTASGKQADGKHRFKSMFADNISASQKAAAKLAASAGLTSDTRQSAAAVETTEEHKRLTKSPLSRKELRQFRELLLTKRAAIVGDVRAMESEALTGGGSGSLSHLPQHMADAGSDTFDQSLALDLAASQRGLLKEIDDALDRIDNNTYGICELLGKPIAEERLKQTPWARFSIEAARQIERLGYAP